jgi:hypothetical protein
VKIKLRDELPVFYFTGIFTPFMAGFTPLVGKHFYKPVTQGYLCLPNQKVY